MNVTTILFLFFLKEYFDPNYLRQTLEKQLTKFEKLSQVVVFSVGIFPCDERPCTRGQKCENKIKAVNTWSILSSDTTTFLSYKNKQESKCVCPEGESGNQAKYLISATIVIEVVIHV